jgi:hypothetical protein
MKGSGRSILGLDWAALVSMVTTPFPVFNRGLILAAAAAATPAAAAATRAMFLHGNKDKYGINFCYDSESGKNHTVADPLLFMRIRNCIFNKIWIQIRIPSFRMTNICKSM